MDINNFHNALNNAFQIPGLGHATPLPQIPQPQPHETASIFGS